MTDQFNELTSQGKRSIAYALSSFPNMNLQELSEETGIEREMLRESQLDFIRRNVSRNNPLWYVESYGRTERIK